MSLLQVVGGESLLEMYRLLKKVEACDQDELTRTHALAALGELDTIMRKCLFPCTSLTKKITILDQFH